MKIKVLFSIIFLVAAFLGVKNLKYLYDFGKEIPKISKNGLFLKCNNPNSTYPQTHYIVLNNNLLGEYNKLFSISMFDSGVSIWESEKFKVSDDKSEYIASTRKEIEHRYKEIGVISDKTTTYSIDRQDLSIVRTIRDNLENDYRWNTSTEYYRCNVTKDDFFNNLKIGLNNGKKHLNEKEKQEKILQKERENKNKI